VRVVPLVLALAACTTAPPATTTPDPTKNPPPTTNEGDVTCPLEIAGTSIAVEDADGGVAFVFATTGDVTQVRERAAKLAATHGTRTPSASGKLTAACNGCMADTLGTPSTAAVVEIPQGAKVVFTAVDPAAAAALGDEARMHGGHLAHSTGTCKMGM